jgi:hypothetical protein
MPQSVSTNPGEGLVESPQDTWRRLASFVKPMSAPRTAFALLALGAILVAAQPVGAECIRIALRDVNTHFMFEATVTKTVGLSGGRHIADLDVGRVWKGDVRRRARLFYDLDSLDAQRFDVGKRYMILAPWFALLDFTDARRVPVDINSPGCGWGVPYGQVEAQLPTLGKSKRAR